MGVSVFLDTTTMELNQMAPMVSTLSLQASQRLACPHYSSSQQLMAPLYSRCALRRHADLQRMCPRDKLSCISGNVPDARSVVFSFQSPRSATVNWGSVVQEERAARERSPPAPPPPAIPGEVPGAGGTADLGPGPPAGGGKPCGSGGGCNSSLSKGVIGAIIAGAVALLAAVGLAAAFFVRRRRAKAKETRPSTGKVRWGCQSRCCTDACRKFRTRSYWSFCDACLTVAASQRLSVLNGKAVILHPLPSKELLRVHARINREN
jgi:hypothetical protein